jgi:hypothetical protein
MGAPGTAQAAQGDPVLLGQDVSGATHRTGLFSTTGEVAVLNDPGNDGGTPGSVGVWGIANNYGVYGEANANSGGTGVLGAGDGGGAGVVGTGGASGPGVVGDGASGTGVYGQTNSGKSGVHAVNFSNGPAIVAECNGGPAVYAPGFSNIDGAGVEAHGQGAAPGVTAFGGPTNGPGMVGTGSGTGAGVSGTTASATGIGVLANNSGGGTALSVVGPASFNRSGVLSIAINKSSVTFSGISLGAASLVLATIQGSVAGIYVQGVTVVSGSSGSFTIHLNKATTKALKVGWFVVN